MRYAARDKWQDARMRCAINTMQRVMHNDARSTRNIIFRIRIIIIIPRIHNTPRNTLYTFTIRYYVNAIATLFASNINNCTMYTR